MNFRGGKNIAIKVPSSQWQTTVDFYRSVAKLPVVSESSECVAFSFGSNTLHIDRCPQLSQAEVWLELIANDVDGAKLYFDKEGITRCDEIESLPEGFNGFWISAPASIVHLVSDQE